ncbi:MAG: helix-turn-helix domain-containing protein [Patescibacteria group bacterium]|nr:helix-turn-helix domain-containing protein [Patescibacteria group bacterium]
MLDSILREMGFSDNSIRIYIRLLETGYSSARQLAENLSMARPTVYDNLKLLINDGLVIEKEEENKKLFSIDDVKNLRYLTQTKIEKLKKNEQMINELLPSLNLKASALQPKIKFYSGIDGIKQVLKDLMWNKNIKTLTMWPISEMMDFLGRDYIEELNRRRIRQNISIRGIWPRDKVIDFKSYPFMGVGKGFLRELRTAPKGMTWSMSYWIYEDKVAFISSRAESFGFVIHSRDFADLIKAQFEQIWPLSKPIKAQPQYTDEFLKTL